MPAREAPIFLNAEQHMGGLAPVGDEDWPLRGGLLGAAGVLIELPAGEASSQQRPSK